MTITFVFLSCGEGSDCFLVKEPPRNFDDNNVKLEICRFTSGMSHP